MRSGWISSPSSDSRRAQAAPPVWASAPLSACHSECQPPAPRSCSSGRAASSTEVSPRTRRAQAIAMAAPTGLRFWGRVEEPPRPGGLAHLAHLGLGQELQVERDLLQRAGGQREGGGQLAHPAAVGVPRQLGLGQVEPRGQLLYDAGAVGSQGSERSHSAAELHGQRHVCQSPPGREDAEKPARDLQPEGGGQRLLEQRPPGHRGVAVLLGQHGAGRSDRAQLGPHQLQRPPAHEHRGGVEHVLAGGAHVHPAGGLPADCLGEPGHQRRRGVARRAPGLGQRVYVEVLGPAGRGDLGGRRRGRPRGRQRGLEVEHGLDPPPARHRCAQRRRHVHRLEQVVHQATAPT